MPPTIEPAYNSLDAIRALFTEYTNSLRMDLAFQSYDEELAGLPGKYAPPDGRLYLARLDERPAGCIALRRHDETCGEMKRLYVRPECRGAKIGRRLVEKILADARDIGYRAILLDTLARLENSVSLYRKLGFKEIPAYYPNPHSDAIYLRLDLR